MQPFWRRKKSKIHVLFGTTKKKRERDSKKAKPEMRKKHDAISTYSSTAWISTVKRWSANCFYCTSYPIQSVKESKNPN